MKFQKFVKKDRLSADKNKKWGCILQIFITSTFKTCMYAVPNPKYIWEYRLLVLL